MRSICVFSFLVCFVGGVSNAFAQDRPDANTPTVADGNSSNTSTPPRAEVLVIPKTTTTPATANSGPGSMIPDGSHTFQPYPYPYYPHSGGAYPQSWGVMQPAPQKTNWFGWQTMIGVIAGDVFTLVGIGTGVEPLLYAGFAGHMLTGPIVQWAHGHVGLGFASLGLNVGLPTLGYLSGALIGNGSFDDLFGALLLGGIGYIAGPTLDISLMSTETVGDTPQGRRGARLLLPSSVGIMPMLDQNRRGLMLVGQF